MKHEELRPEILEIHFKPEGYVSTGDAEFLDQFLVLLASRGLEPLKLVYSGFSGRKVDPVQGLPRYSYTYAMNIPGWNQAIKRRVDTPADYAKDVDEPCIAVYDMTLLAEAYSVKHINPDDDDMTSATIELGNIEKGDDLSSMDPERIVDETVVHKNFPDGSPTDALVALIYLDE